jgi:ABC-2 type transport system permease protein
MPVFDQGYQHWQGQLAGHGWRWLAVTRHGVRTGMQNRYVRRLLFGAWLPALLLAGVVCLWGMTEDPSSWAGKLIRSFGFLRDLADRPREYRGAAWTIAFHVFLQAELYFSMVLVLLVGPGLISQDLRFNALPLYFSRPVRRIDYFVGKLGVIGFFLGAVTVVPAVAAWILGVLFSLDPTVVVDTFRVLVAMIVYGVIVTVSAGLFMLALSSLTRSSRYVGVIWAGIWLVTLGASAMLQEINRHQIQRKSMASDARLQQINGEISEIETRLGHRRGGPRFQGPPQPPQPPQPIPDAERWRLQDRLNTLYQERGNLMNNAWGEAQQVYEGEQRSDWRPLVSYTANLQRVGYALLGSRQAWEKVDQLSEARNQQQQQRGLPPGAVVLRTPPLASRMVPSYPWYWSAVILLALAAVSVWVLNGRVKSLDRLR